MIALVASRLLPLPVVCMEDIDLRCLRSPANCLPSGSKTVKSVQKWRGFAFEVKAASFGLAALVVAIMHNSYFEGYHALILACITLIQQSQQNGE